jgi:hypothetical protein
LLCIGYFNKGIWEKVSAKDRNKPKHLHRTPGHGNSARDIENFREKPEPLTPALQIRIFGKTPLSTKKWPKKISKKVKKKLTSDKRGFTFCKT